MPDTTDRLELPYILPDQAQKHVTHNEALVRLDALVHLAVLDRDRSEAPAEPAAGDRHIVATGASGEWAGRSGGVAFWQDGVWMFLDPQPGWRAWCGAEAALLLFDGSGWVAAGLGAAELAGGALAQLGVNTAADDFNRLAVKTSALLLSHDDVSGSGNGSVLASVNKESAAKDAGFNFQSDWSTRALVGLFGDEDFRIKVSADGATFRDAMAIERATGRVSFPQTGELGQIVAGHFAKADPDSVVFTRTGNGTLELKAGTLVAVAGFVHVFSMPTAVQMPTLTAGTDYAVYVCSDGSVRADANFSVPSGYDAATSRKIGGFHYAAGGNAPGYNTGGDLVPQINPCSLWDQKWRPACADPRGMTLVAGKFWCDIYLLGVNHHVNGTSRNGVAIANGSAPPKIPAVFGGNGATAYGSLNWWQAVETLASHGKELLSYGDFALASYGTTESQSRGNDAVTTGIATTNVGSTKADEKFTSRWGVIQASGCYWVWSRDQGGAYASGWQDQAAGRGWVQNQPNVARLGGNWSIGAPAGSRGADWTLTPWTSGGNIGARGRCAHRCQV